MVAITEYSVEMVKDPFGILKGKRYEFIIDVDVDEDDELYTEQGVALRVIYGVDEEKQGIVKYDILERSTEKPLDFDLEDEELEELETFCKEHWPEAEV